MMNAQAQVRELLNDMRNAVHDPVRMLKLSEQIEVLTSSYMVPMIQDPFPQLKLTGLQRRVIARLHDQKGKVVSKNALLNAMYFDKQREAHGKIVDVIVCHLRKRVRELGYVIENVWGEGYRLCDLSLQVAS